MTLVVWDEECFQLNVPTTTISINELYIESENIESQPKFVIYLWGRKE